MALRQLRFYDDDILRKKCKFVDLIDDKIRQILNDMADTILKSRILLYLQEETL